MKILTEVNKVSLLLEETKNKIKEFHQNQNLVQFDQEMAIFPIDLNMTTISYTVEVFGSVTREVTKYTPRTRDNDEEVELSESAIFIGEVAIFDQAGDLYYSDELNFKF